MYYYIRGTPLNGNKVAVSVASDVGKTLQFVILNYLFNNPTVKQSSYDRVHVISHPMSVFYNKTCVSKYDLLNEFLWLLSIFNNTKIGKIYVYLDSCNITVPQNNPTVPHRIVLILLYSRCIIVFQNNSFYNIPDWNNNHSVRTK